MRERSPRLGQLVSRKRLSYIGELNAASFRTEMAMGSTRSVVLAVFATDRRVLAQALS